MLVKAIKFKYKKATPEQSGFFESELLKYMLERTREINISGELQVNRGF